MPTISQIRGMLLEEAILYFLKNSGYCTVEQVGSDETLQRGSAGLEVIGRGDVHQIDAIADYDETPPFSYPIRLLVEAKCYRQGYPVGLPVVRNAVGVVKDVSEYWVTRRRSGTATKSRYEVSKPRYHYQYAVFSTSGFSGNAQRYAFAHDIFLFPLDNSAYFEPIARILLYELLSEQFGVRSWKDNIPDIELVELRSLVRSYLRSRGSQSMQEIERQLPAEALAAMERFFDACWQIRVGFIVKLGVGFPVFLVPNPEIEWNELRDLTRVDIQRDLEDDSWYIVSREGGGIFSFDLPGDVFELYSEWYPEDYAGVDQNRIQAKLTYPDQPRRIFDFNLRRGWLDQTLENSHKYRGGYEQNEEGIEL